MFWDGKPVAVCKMACENEIQQAQGPEYPMDDEQQDTVIVIPANHSCVNT